MKNSPQQLIIKALGTVVLCVGFVYMVTRTPFMPQTSTGPGAIVPGGQQQALMLKNITLDTGTASHQLPTMDAINSAMPSLGLFKARYGTSIANPGFATQEHEMPGPCTGAGRRYIEQVCPECQIMTGGPQPGQPEMLLWSGEDPGYSKAGAVSANCSNTADDGSVIVNVLQFGGGPV
ncbi:MAG: hypothetical protein KAG70_12135, partial [Alcanivorax sp.]|nr:hypothetical protein [Alcanivorax sp.]